MTRQDSVLQSYPKTVSAGPAIFTTCRTVITRAYQGCLEFALFNKTDIKERLLSSCLTKQQIGLMFAYLSRPKTVLSSQYEGAIEWDEGAERYRLCWKKDGRGNIFPPVFYLYCLYLFGLIHCIRRLYLFPPWSNTLAWFNWLIQPHRCYENTTRCAGSQVHSLFSRRKT